MWTRQKFVAAALKYKLPSFSTLWTARNLPVIQYIRGVIDK